ncbi:gram-negative porin family protein [Burkholderia cenocepacia]|uniref:Gram-negative porin family protein n=1 Tax=Burkholderia cenocepacia TaxID=95486 RepID=A0AAN0RY81_9BURK|nr:gram-negative porin family protein [Burkholderia cenocepacia]
MSSKFSRRAIALSIFLFGNALPCAHAQSNVTFYGVIDSGLLYTSRTLDPVTGKKEGHQFAALSGGLTPSQFGLKGTEDLGGGVSAIFTLESGLDITKGSFTDSNGNLFGRQAWVGIQSDRGTIKAGVQYSPFVLSLVATDARSASFFGSLTPIYVDSVMVTGIFNANSISYTSPTILGFQGSAMLALGGEAGQFQAGRQYSAMLNYTHGPILISAAMYNGNAGGTAATTPIPSTVAFSGRTLGASYSFEHLSVRAAFVSYKVAGAFDRRVYGGGLDYQITPAIDSNLGLWYVDDAADSGSHSVLAAVGMTYSLSKATLLYSQLGFVNNRGSMNIGLSANGALYGPSGSTLGAAFGIRHLF